MAEKWDYDLPGARAVVRDYDALVARALEVLDGPPFWKAAYVSDGQFARLSIEGDKATIRWQDTRTSYGNDWETYEESTSFPAAYLAMSADELAAFKAKAAEDYKRERAAREARADREAEAKERRLLAKLQQKYAR